MGIIHRIEIDDHADKWTIAHLRDCEEKPAKEFELIPDQAGYRKLLSSAKSLGGTVRFVYEAGPCGYDLYRRLNQAGFRCDVAAPSLTPGKPGQRVKTNRRDALKLARYLRAGELTLITVPDQDRESLRDLTRRALRAGGPLHQGHPGRSDEARVRVVHRCAERAAGDRHRVGHDRHRTRGACGRRGYVQRSAITYLAQRASQKSRGAPPRSEPSRDATSRSRDGRRPNVRV